VYFRLLHFILNFNETFYLMENIDKYSKIGGKTKIIIHFEFF